VVSAKEGFERLAAKTFDLIFCDLMMPVMTGMEFFAELKEKQPEMCDRVVFMSGGVFSAESRDFVRCHEARTLAKPLSTPLLRRLASGGSLRDED
jgi:two-component system NtrC family sensor kinase